MSAIFCMLFLTTPLDAQAPAMPGPQTPTPRSEAPQEPTPAGKAPQDAAPAVRVPTFPNSTCPIMGKKASLPLFADTEHGRIYVCCKPCIRKVQADAKKAYDTAYPTTEDAHNTVCPVTGETIGEDSVAVVLQGVRIQLCCDGCLAEARRDSQITLAKAKAPAPGLEDLQNPTCPVDGRPVQPNAFAVVATAIVRLSSPSHVAELEKSPQALVDKARAERKGGEGEPSHRPRPDRLPETPAPKQRGGQPDGKENS